VLDALGATGSVLGGNTQASLAYEGHCICFRLSQLDMHLCVCERDSWLRFRPGLSLSLTHILELPLSSGAAVCHGMLSVYSPTALRRNDPFGELEYHNTIIVGTYLCYFMRDGYFPLCPSIYSKWSPYRYMLIRLAIPAYDEILHFIRFTLTADIIIRASCR